MVIISGETAFKIENICIRLLQVAIAVGVLQALFALYTPEIPAEPGLPH